MSSKDLISRAQVIPPLQGTLALANLAAGLLNNNRTEKIKHWHPHKPAGEELAQLQKQCNDTSKLSKAAELARKTGDTKQDAVEDHTYPDAATWLSHAGKLADQYADGLVDFIWSRLPGLPGAAAQSTEQAKVAPHHLPQDAAAAKSTDSVCSADGSCLTYKEPAEVAKTTGGKSSLDDTRKPTSPLPTPQPGNHVSPTSFTTDRFIRDVSPHYLVRTTPAFRELTDIRGGIFLISDFHHNPSVQQATRAVLGRYAGGKGSKNVVLIEAMPETLADSEVAAQRCFGIPANRCIGIDQHDHDVLAREWANFLNDVAKNVMNAAHGGRDVTTEHNQYGQKMSQGDIYGAQAVVMKLLDERIAKGGKAAKTFKANKKKLENYEKRVSDEVYKNAPKRDKHFLTEILKHKDPEYALFVVFGAAHAFEALEELDKQGEPAAMITPPEPLKALLDNNKASKKPNEPRFKPLEYWAD